MKHADGLCVCVDGATKSSSPGGSRLSKGARSHEKHYAKLAEHGRIHKIFDYLESALGRAGSPPDTATLGELETKAAHSVAKVTGCNAADLKKQMRAYHKTKGLPADTKLRADPFGKKPNPPFGSMGTRTMTGDV